MRIITQKIQDTAQSMVTQINPLTLDFLNKLSLNNNREWFQAHKNQYLSAHEDVIAFTEKLIDQMNHLDKLVPRSAKQSLYRIYRDIRFSKDKTPYKTGFMGSMKRDTKWLRGGYYFKITPNNTTIVVGGFWGPNTKDIGRIRQEIASDPFPLRKIIHSNSFKSNFGELTGNELKTAPRGYSKDHPDIDLLRKKQFLLIQHFSDEDVLKKDFLKKVIKTYQAMRPFLDYMSEVLTTDINGVPID